jgi:hypothetical protein
MVGLSYEPTSRKVKFALLKMADLPKDASLGLLIGQCHFKAI